MSKFGSPAYQVTNALKTLFTPGSSRHSDKRAGQVDKHIYGIHTMRAYVEDGTRFAIWARDQYGVKNVREITPEMACAYIDDLAARERSGGYIGRVKAALGKLSVALHGYRWELGTGWHSDPHPERVYTPDEAAQIIDDLQRHARDPQAADVVRLQTVAGLRREEAVRLRGQDIDPDRGLIHLERGTKGGRLRQVQVDREHAGFLQSLKARAAGCSDGCVFQGRGSLGRRVEQAVDQACRRLGLVDRGTHGFRKTFARARYDQYQAEGMSDPEARQALTGDLGHGRRQVTYSYVSRA